MSIKRKSLRAAMMSMGLAAVLCAGTGVSFAATSGSHGIGSGNQVSVPVTAPIDACGNGVAVIGGALGNCQGGASVDGGDRGSLQGAHTNGRGGILSGNQVSVPVTAPVDVCGNGVAVIGGALGNCQGGASVDGGDRGSLQGAHTNGRGGILSGNQAGIPVTAPINACGNAVAVIGGALAHCPGGASVTDDERDSYGPLSATQDAQSSASDRADDNGSGDSDGSGSTLPLLGQLPQLPKLPVLGN